jgi:hypothetical protein
MGVKRGDVFSGGGGEMAGTTNHRLKNPSRPLPAPRRWAAFCIWQGSEGARTRNPVIIDFFLQSGSNCLFPVR